MSDTQSNKSSSQNMQAAIDQIQSAAADLKKNGVTIYDQMLGANTDAVIQARKDAESAIADYQQKTADIRKTDDESGWQKFSDDFHNFFARQRADMSQDQIERDIEKAKNKADDAEQRAERSLEHVVEALQAARVALVDAAQAQAYSDELAQDLSPAS